MEERRSHGTSTSPLSPALSVGATIYVSGQVALDPSGDPISDSVEAQTRQVLNNIRDLLREAGVGLDCVVKTTVYLKDVKRDFAAMNGVYQEFFPGLKPARSTIGAELAVDALIEIDAIAQRP